MLHLSLSTEGLWEEGQWEGQVEHEIKHFITVSEIAVKLYLAIKQANDSPSSKLKYLGPKAIIVLSKLFDRAMAMNNLHHTQHLGNPAHSPVCVLCR